MFAKDLEEKAKIRIDAGKISVALGQLRAFPAGYEGTPAAGRRATLWVVAGTATGTYIHALLAAAGLSALVMRSSEAFLVVKIVGGAYLIGLGLLTIWRTRRRRAGSAPCRR